MTRTIFHPKTLIVLAGVSCEERGGRIGKTGARRTLPRTRLDAFKCELIAGLRCIYEAQDLCPPDESAVGQVEV